MYKVPKAPDQNGSVYTVTLSDNLGHMKHVHRSLLKNKVEYVTTCAPSASIELLETVPVEEPMQVVSGFYWFLNLLRPQAIANKDRRPLPPAYQVSQNRQHPLWCRSAPISCQLRLVFKIRLLLYIGLLALMLGRHHLPQAVGSRTIGAVNSQAPVPNTSTLFRPRQ